MPVIPRDCILAPAEAVDLLEKNLSDLMPHEYRTLRELEKIASKVDDCWLLKVGIRRAKLHNAEVGV